MNRFETIVDAVKQTPKTTIVVAAADETDVLASTVHARTEGLAEVVYVGAADRIRQLAAEVQLAIDGIEIINAPDPAQAALLAIRLIKAGQAQVLMKGRVSTGQILGMVLKDEDLKRQGGGEHFLSHITLFEWEGRLKIFSDAGLNIAPTLEQKRRIAQNALTVARKLDLPQPRMAFLSASEKVSPKMPSSVEAEELAQMDWGDAIAGGPLALDGALFAEAYRIKGVPSPVEGQADILICPNIEAGNVLYKTLAWMLKAAMAGAMAGAPVPFVLTSRADSEIVKFLSIATTLYLSA